MDDLAPGTPRARLRLPGGVAELDARAAPRAPAPQSRDRIYIVAWPEGEKAPDLDRVVQPRAHCERCGVSVDAVQSFKAKRSVGRYRQAYVYCCPRCGAIVEPGWLPAAAAIDWSIPGERVGDRLKPKTRARIAAGIARYWGPLHLEAAGNQYDATDPKHPRHGDPNAYYRAWPTDEPLRALHTSNSKALAVPVKGRDGKAAAPIDAAMRTLTTRAETALVQSYYGSTMEARPASDPLGTLTTVDRYAVVKPPFIAEMYGTSTARSVEEPAGTFTAGGNHHGLIRDPFMLDRRFEYRVRSVDEPFSTITANDTSKALIHRMNTGGAEMTTPAHEELRTLTTAGHQAILRSPKRDVSLADLKAAEELVPDVLFRMFRPHEVAAGMAFPADYKWQPPDRNKPISNRDLVKAAGNAVTPPSARDLVAVCVESLGYEVERAA
jgi:DNA (cytosine-5)-methyltransferase 1